MSERRAPECKINYCCPYHSKLCQGVCGGDRGDRDEMGVDIDEIADDKGFLMIAWGDECMIMYPSEDVVTRYIVPEESKALFCAQDRGDDIRGRTLLLNPVAKS